MPGRDADGRPVEPPRQPCQRPRCRGSDGQTRSSRPPPAQSAVFGAAGRGRPTGGPLRAAGADQAALGSIVTFSCFLSLGSGIVTSTTPSLVCALIFLGSTPAGSAIDRENAP